MLKCLLNKCLMSICDQALHITVARGEYTTHYSTVHLKMVKMVNDVMFFAFYHN